MAFPKIPDGIKPYLITTERARDMRNFYINNQYDAITKSIPDGITGQKKYVETEYVWYPIEVLENYIQYARDIQKSTDTEIDGIRIYFGAYEDGSEMPDNEKEYYNRQTIIMLPTTPAPKERHVDKDENSKHDSIYLCSKSKKVKVIDLSDRKNDLSNQNSALNEGHAKPPPPWPQ